MQAPLPGLGVEPGIERRLGPAPGHHGAHQAHRGVRVRRPPLHVRGVRDRGRDDLRVRPCHGVRHGTPRPPEGLRRGRIAQRRRRALHVRGGHDAARSAGPDGGQIHTVPARKGPHGGGRLHPPTRRGRPLRRRGHVLRGQFPRDGAPVDRRALVEVHERGARRDDIPRVPVDARDPARPWRRDLDDGLVGLNREKRLVGHHVISRRHVPGDDLGLLEALTEVGQRERPHAYSRTSRAAARMRPR